MPTLILSPRYDEDSIALWRAASAEGWSVVRTQGWRVDPDASRDRPVIYGEPLFAAAVAAQLRCLLLEPPFDFLTRLPHRFLGRIVRFGHGSDIPSFGFPGFFKPADDKCFPAKVYRSEAELPAHAIPDETPVLWSEPVQWSVEFRCFIADRRCLTLSPYARHSALAQAHDGSWPAAPEEDGAARQFATDLLSVADLDMPPAFALDIGMLADGNWAVVEANPCWGAGIYGCDPGHVLQTLRRACVAQEGAGPECLRWVNTRRE
jgi:hypothetical protein